MSYDRAVIHYGRANPKHKEGWGLSTGKSRVILVQTNDCEVKKNTGLIAEENFVSVRK